MTNAQHVVTQLSNALLDSVNDWHAVTGDPGCPAGPLYAAFMTTGLGLDSFEAIMGTLVKAGKVTKRGHRYYPR